MSLEKSAPKHWVHYKVTCEVILCWAWVWVSIWTSTCDFHAQSEIIHVV
jgi:hypothetical protein